MLWLPIESFMPKGEYSLRLVDGASFGGLVFLSLMPLVVAASAEGRDTAETVKEPPVSAVGSRGYVPDANCASCHSKIFESFSRVAMAKSFYRPRPESAIERFGSFTHAPSGRVYEMTLREEQYVFRRFQLDQHGQPINVLEQTVDWVLGSGNHSRTYLYATPGGELYQLPIAWYSQKDSWGMAPGFDRPDHSGIQRLVRRECMFCHNAYPDVPAGSDSYWQPHLFPRNLAEGIGCQRCHGPGAAHEWLMLNPDYLRDDLAIVNPARLDTQLQSDVCYQCHMQPSVALIGVRSFGRGVYSFRPGQALGDYQPTLDVVEEGKSKVERFEINHHPYRLEQSRCFQLSGGSLGCLTCHDPHVKVPVEARSSHYATKCLGCHGDDLGLATVHDGRLPEECTSCHMPERRPVDVVHVTMTDHRIQRPGDLENLVRARPETDPTLIDARFLYPERSPVGDLIDIYRATAVIRAGGRYAGSAVTRLDQLLARSDEPPLEPLLDLAKGQLQLHELGKLERTTERILRRWPLLPTALDWLAIVRDAEGRREEAATLLERAVEQNPFRVETRYNLALVLAGAGHHREAEKVLEQVVELRPNLAAAWFHLGKARMANSANGSAAASFRRALEIDPRHSRSYVALAEVLRLLGDREEAERFLRHGLRTAARKDLVVEALDRFADEVTAID